MRNISWKWYGLLAVQWGAMALGALGLIALSLYLSTQGFAAWYQISMWGLIPGVGAWLAYWATRRGLSAYVAWFAAPIVQTCVHWAMTGYPPSSAGMPIVAALISMVAASAADVLNRREAYKRKK